MRRHDRFSALALAEVENGELSRTDLCAILELPSRPAPGDLDRAARRALYEKGAALLREGGQISPRWEDFLSARSAPPASRSPCR